MNNSLFNLLFHHRDSLYVNKKNELDWHYRWNLVGRMIAWWKDRKGEKLQAAIERVFHDFQCNIKSDKTHTRSFQNREFTLIEITEKLESTNYCPTAITSIKNQLKKRDAKEKIQTKEALYMAPTLATAPLIEISSPELEKEQTKQLAKEINKTLLNQQILTKREQKFALALQKNPNSEPAAKTLPFYPDLAILQFFLTDYVGGGKGNQLSNAIHFFQHYLALYCQAYPKEKIANQVQQQLKNFYEPSSLLSLAQVEEELIQILTKERSVIFTGGYIHSDGGHGLVYELSLDREDYITMHLTNSGEGLNYHPPYLNNDQPTDCPYFYRTLTLPKTTLAALKSSQYLPLILSFRRERVPVDQLKDRLYLSEAAPSIDSLYTILIQGWPGRGSIKASNPGGNQRANSCAVQSLVKWLKAQYKEANQEYSLLNFWIKAQALRDILQNSAPLPAHFLKDVLRKLSSQVSKLDQSLAQHREIFNTWSQLAPLIEQRIQIESLKEQEQLRVDSLYFKQGIDLTKATPIDEGKTKEFRRYDSNQSFTYEHCLAGEMPPIATINSLSDHFIDTASNETSYRLNFLRILPDFDQFNFERAITSLYKQDNQERLTNISQERQAHIIKSNREQFFTSLINITQSFFYQLKEAHHSLHIPDAFMIDLLNGWMIVYREAQKEGKITAPVFLEWIEGLEHILDSYKVEYQLPTVESKNRFKALVKFCQQEKSRLYNEVKQEERGAANLWHLSIEDGQSNHVGKPFTQSIDNRTQLPAMAKFAYQVASGNWQQYPFMVQDKKEIEKYALAFGSTLNEIPYYDLLRKSLAYFYILGDRHLYCKIEPFNPSKKVDAVDAIFGHKKKTPKVIEVSSIEGETGKVAIFSELPLLSRHPSLAPNENSHYYYPQYHLPKTQQRYQKLQDLNQRTLTISNKQERHYPFFSLEDEQAFLTFVQLEPYTKLTEGLKFFEKHLDQLAQPHYQAAFEYLLWGGENSLIEWLEQDASHAKATLPLLFNFIKNSFSLLTSHKNRAPFSLTFLMHLELKLCKLSETFAPAHKENYLNGLLDQWEKLIELGRQQPLLASSLSQAILAALPVLESSAWLRGNFGYVSLIAATLLLECQQETKLAARYYDPIDLEYGYHSFKKLLKTHAEKTVWKEALAKLAIPFSSVEYEKEYVLVNHSSGSLRFDLLGRSVNHNKEQTYQDDEAIVVPAKIQQSADYQSIFGQQPLFTKFYKKENSEIYVIKYRGQTYKIVYDSSKSKSINLFKLEGDQELQLVSKKDDHNRFDLASRLFKDSHTIWQKENLAYLENKETGQLEMQTDGKTIQRVENKQLTGELLGYFDKQSDLYQLFNRIEHPLYILAWLKPHITRIDLPRLGLTFTAVKKQGVNALLCEEHPGFFIATNQSLACFPHLQNLLILENAQGQKKIWIPLKQVESYKYLPYQATRIHFKGDYNEKITYLLFDLAAEQTFPSYAKQNLSSILFLFYLSLKTRQYGQALKMIKESAFIHSKKRCTEKEEKIFEWIFDKKQKDAKHIDHHPHAIALRLHILAWVADQRYYSITNSLSLSRSYFKEDWQAYHTIKNHLGLYKLSKKKEKLLTSLYKVKKPIQQSLPQTYHLKKSDAGKMSRDFRVLWSLRNQILEQADHPLPPTSFSAPGEEFIFNFLAYYQLAKEKDAPQFFLLKRQLAALTADQDRMISQCVFLLIAAIQIQDTPSIAEMRALFCLEGAYEFDKEFEKICEKIDKNISKTSFILKDWYSGGAVTQEISAQNLVDQKSNQILEGQKIILRPAALTYNQAKVHVVLQLEEIQEQLVVDDHSIIAKRQPLLATERQAAEVIQSWTKGQMQVAEHQQDPLTAAEFRRLAKGTDLYLKELDNKTTAVSLTQDKQQIMGVLEQYQLAITQQEQELKVLKKRILTLANETHQEHHFILELQRDLRFKFEIETLLIALGRQDFQALRHSNPTLTDQEIQQLINLVGQYALLKTEMQKKQRCQQALQTYQDLLHINSEPVALELAAQSYVAQSQATRAYAVNASPELLVFEALSHILLRQEQVDALQLLNQKGWTLFEARTGFGKSTALERLWLLLTAKEDTLAIMIAPATLFEQQEAGLQTFLQQAYRLFGYRLDFSRESPSMAEDIQTILKDLKRAQRKRQPVFMSDQTAHNLFVLKPKELAAQKSNPVALVALLELKKYVKQKAVLFIDEPHKVLDDSQESNYSIGMNQFFKPERLVLSAHLYQAFFKVIDQRYRVECWQTTASKQLPLLTEKAYQQLLPELVEAIIKQTTLAIDDQPKAYLLGQLDSQDQMQYEKQLQTLEPKLLANQIRILHDQLHHYLFQTLSQNANEHYGTLDLAQQRIAIPLEDARHPKEGNEYCSPDQILNFTIQLNMRTPFSLDYVQRFFEQLANEASTEMEKKEMNLKETRGYQQFLLLTKLMGAQAPKSLLNLKPAELEHFIAQLEQHIPLRLQFIALSVLPHLRRYEEKIVSTPHLLVACFKEVVGASGTLSLQNLPSQFNIVQDELAMARTVITMQRKYAQAEPIYECPTEESSEIIKLLPQAAKASGLTHPSVLIEIGAVLRDYPALLQVAQELLIQFPHFKGVATFDQQGLPIVLKQGMKKFIPHALAHLPESQLFWLYAQKDTTGTDRQLAPTAQALVFINEHNDLSSLVQGIGRLRGIHLGQTARLLLTKNAALAIKHCLAKEPDTALSYLDILEYTVKKLALNKGQHNFPSLDLKGQAILENLFWQESLKGTPQEFEQNFQHLRHLFVEDTSDQPLQQASLQAHLSPIDQGLDKLKRQFRQRLTKIQTALIGQPLAQKYQEESLLAEWERAKEQMLYPKEVKLNDNTQHTSMASAETQTTATKQTTQQQLLNLQAEEQEEKQVETNSMQLASSLANLSGKQSLPHRNQITFHPLKEAFQHPKLQKFIPLFSDQLSISENALLTVQGDSLAMPGWITGYMKPLHYVLIEYQNHEITQFNICDQMEAAQLCQQKRKKGTVWLVNQGVMTSFDGQTTDKLKADPQLANSLAILELQMRLLDGDLNFTKQQETLLKNWLTANKKPLLKQFMQEILLPLHPRLLTSLSYKILIES